MEKERNIWKIKKAMKIYRKIWKYMEIYDNINMLTKKHQNLHIKNESIMDEIMNDKL